MLISWLNVANMYANTSGHRQSGLNGPKHTWQHLCTLSTLFFPAGRETADVKFATCGGEESERLSKRTQKRNGSENEEENVVAQLGKWSIPLERILNYARNWDDGRTVPNAVCISCVASLMTCVPDLCMFFILAFGAACDLHYRQSAAATVGSWHVAGDTEDHKIWWAVTRATRVENQTINEAEYHLTFFFLTYHHLSAC